MRVIQEVGQTICNLDGNKRFLLWGDYNGVVFKFDLESGSAGGGEDALWSIESGALGHGDQF